MEGWISLHRKIRKNTIFNDMELLRLWLICLTEATHKEREQIVGRQTVHLQPGEFVTGRFDLQEMYNSGLKRDQQKSPKTVWRWLEALEIGDFLTINSTNKFSVISILKWDKYQSSDHEDDQQVTNKRPTSDQQVTTNNNVNNDNNYIKEIKDIYTFWNQQEIIVHRELPKKVESKINARSKTYTFDEIKTAISNYKTIVSSELYWYTHKFTLDKFMDPKNLEQFMTANNPFENFRKQKGGGNSAKYGKNDGRGNAQTGYDQSEFEDLIFGSPAKVRMQ